MNIPRPNPSVFALVAALLVFANAPNATASRFDDPVVIAQQHLQQAIANEVNHVPGWGADLRACANELSNLGLYDDAIYAVNTLLADPENPFDRITGLSMIIDYTEQNDDSSGALAQALNGIAICNGDDDLRGYFPDLYASLYGRCAMLQFSNGHDTDAFVMVTRLLEGTPNYLPDDVRETMLANRVAIAESLGDPETVSGAITDLLTFNPNYGQMDGSSILLQLAQYTAQDAGLWGDEYITNVTALWNSSAIMGFPQSIAVGQALAAARLERGEDVQAYDATANALGRLDAHKVAWLLLSVPGYDQDWASVVELDFLQFLRTGSLHQRVWLAMWADYRLMARSDVTDDQVAMLLEEYTALNQAVFANDPSTPPNGLGVIPDQLGVSHPELATVLETSFGTDGAVPVKIISPGPLRFSNSTNWTSGFSIYGGSESLDGWQSVSCFVVRGPTDTLVGEPATIGLSRASAQVVHPGVYAVVPKTGVRFDLGSNVATANCPHVIWPTGLDSGPGNGFGVYYFRVAPDCDANAANDFIQIATGRASTPQVELDVNNNGVLDSCESGNPCRADFDGDHTVAVQDIFAFLNAWFMADSHCDIDLNGDVEVADIFAFLNLWFAYNPANPC